MLRLVFQFVCKYFRGGIRAGPDPDQLQVVFNPIQTDRVFAFGSLKQMQMKATWLILYKIPREIWKDVEAEFSTIRSSGGS